MREISTEQRIERLRMENPWWEGLHEIPPRYREVKPRPYIELFYPKVIGRTFRRALVLMGPRRVGKTWMLHHTIERIIQEEKIDPQKICYVSIEVPLFSGMGLEELLKLYEQANGIDITKTETYFFIDEIQYLHEWERHLKVIVDRFDSVKCIVSGSAAAALKMKSMESGAGRFTDFFLPPLTFYEYMELIKQKQPDLFSQSEKGINALNRDFINYINYGGYPEIAYAESIENSLIRSDIIEKVLLKDLPSLYGIQDIMELNHLFNMLAYNTGYEVSLDELSQKSRLAKNTLKKYIEYFESAFLIRKLRRVDQNSRRFTRENFFKVYLTNTSMRAALFSPLKDGDPELGHLVETAVVSQYVHLPGEMYYARWKKGEVDLIGVDQQFKPDFVCEVKWSDKYPDEPGKLSNVIEFCLKNNIKKALITTKTIEREVEFRNVTLMFMPASVFCFTIGKAAIQGKIQAMKVLKNINASVFFEGLDFSAE